MLNINRVTLLGHAGRDAEGRTLQDGERTASFNLATTRRWKGREGEALKKTEWHRIVVYGGSVKPTEELVRKGAAVLVEGRLATRQFDDKQGRARQVTEVIVAGPQGMVNVLSRKPAGDEEARTAAPEAGGGDGAAGGGDGAAGGGDGAAGDGDEDA